MNRTFWVIIITVLAAGGCTDPVRDKQIADLGPEEPGVPPGDDHRPGQPCLHCHSEGGPAANKPFALAGTVYKNEAPDSEGADQITVQFVDAKNNHPRENPSTTPSGNFYVRLDMWPDLAFPVRVGLYPKDPDANTPPTQVMKSLISREGSCNFCHRNNIDLKSIEDPDEYDDAIDYLRSSAGQIYVTAGGGK